MGAVSDAIAPVIPAGFYYKTFMWPRPLWTRIYEPFLRLMAGLGRAPKAADPDRYMHRYAHADALVVGGGPAGLAAALAAAEAGASVILANEDNDFGGALLTEPNATIDGRAAADWVAHTLAALAATQRVRLLKRTTAFGYFAQNFVGLVERVTDHLADPDPRSPRERLWQVRAKEVVLATGAIERPLVFPENDRPGIMLAGAARTYLNRYGAIAGKRAVVTTATDAAYSAALDLHQAGVEIAAICDLRPEPTGDEVAAALEARIPVWPSTSICGTHGRLRIRAAEIGAIEASGRVRGREKLDCDLLLMSGGWTPSVHLFSQSRGHLRFDAERGAFVPDVSAQKERSVGACRGTYDLAQCLAEGTAAGEDAARAMTTGRAYYVTGVSSDSGGFLGRVPHNRRPERVKAFVDFQNDVTARDLTLAVSEGFRSIEHVKRYTTTGMATDQGKTANMNALAVVAAALGKPLPEVGLTTFRMPYTPVTFGAIAGTRARGLARPGAQDADPRLGGGRGRRLRGRRNLEAGAIFPAGRRGHGGGGGARVPRGEDRGRALRRLDARQDRGGRAGRGRVPRSHVRQHALETRGRALPLRGDAVGSRHRDRRRDRRADCARPFPRHHHDRQRRGGAPSHGGLSADRVSRT